MYHYKLMDKHKKEILCNLFKITNLSNFSWTNDNALYRTFCKLVNTCSSFISNLLHIYLQTPCIALKDV